MSRPQVGVLMPVKDCGRWLMPAVTSIVSQTMPDWELLIVDDGTTDGSLKGPLELAKSDKRIRIVRSSGTGGAQALNCGARLSNAPFLARMDGDDVALPNRLQRQLAEFQKRPELGMVGAWARVLIEERLTDEPMKTPVGPANVRAKMLDQAALISPTFFFRREAWERVGGFRYWMMLTEDYDFTARVSRFYDVDNIPEVLLNYRIHATQTTASRLRDLALHSMMAQRVANAVAAGNPDPLEPFQEISDSMKRALGLTPKVILARTMAITEYRVQLLLKLGAPKQAHLTLQEVRKDLTPHELQLWRRHLDWLQAQVYWFSNRPVATAATLARGCVRNPTLTTMVGKSLLRKAARRLPSRLTARLFPQEER